MNYAFDLNGGSHSPVIKTYKISATMSTAGVYVTAATANLAGIVLGLTTTVTEQLGVTVDTGTYTTTQATDMIEGDVAVIVSPTAVYKMLMANSATAGTQLAITTNSSANTAGTTVTITTGDPDPSGTSMDEGTIACVAGANVGLTRKITSVSATTAVVTVPFPQTIASSDVFIIVPWTPGDTAADNIQTTSNIAQARQDIAVGTGADLRPWELEFDFASQDQARRNSYVYATLVAHVGTVGT